MAKTKPSTRAPSKPSTLLQHDPTRPRPRKSKPPPSPSTLLAEASAFLVSSEPDRALPLALRALASLQSTPPNAAALPALNILAQIQLELGDGDAARGYFLQAAELDPEGRLLESEGGGPEKYLWLAQLSEEGGRESVEWFERGCAVLRRQIASLKTTVQESNEDTGAVYDYDSRKLNEIENIPLTSAIEEKKRKLAEALCGIVEIYMTDLSLEPDAELQCEHLIAEALQVAPKAPEPLQTLASIRISQLKVDEAKEALTRSVSLWKDIEVEDGEDNDVSEASEVPDFPTRISLARLLMEVSMLDEALTVLERLINEDDQSVEAWYLGGWCLYLAAEANKEASSQDELKNSRQWLQESLRLYDFLEYEDDRLRDHALELVTDLNRELGDGDGDDDDAEDDVDGADWEDEDRDEDQAMEGTR